MGIVVLASPSCRGCRRRSRPRRARDQRPRLPEAAAAGARLGGAAVVPLRRVVGRGVRGLRAARRDRHRGADEHVRRHHDGDDHGRGGRLLHRGPGRSRRSARPRSGSRSCSCRSSASASCCGTARCFAATARCSATRSAAVRLPARHRRRAARGHPLRRGALRRRRQHPPRPVPVGVRDHGHRLRLGRLRGVVERRPGRAAYADVRRRLRGLGRGRSQGGPRAPRRADGRPRGAPDRAPSAAGPGAPHRPHRRGTGAAGRRRTSCSTSACSPSASSRSQPTPRSAARQSAWTRRFRIGRDARRRRPRRSAPPARWDPFARYGDTAS